MTPAVRFEVDPSGPERPRVRYWCPVDSREWYCYVYRLTAVAWYGYDAVRERERSIT